MTTPTDSPWAPAASLSNPLEPLEPIAAAGPVLRGGYPVWTARIDSGWGPEDGVAPPPDVRSAACSVELRFVGRRPPGQIDQIGRRGHDGRDDGSARDAEAEPASRASSWEERCRVLSAIEGRALHDLPLAGLRQVHSARVLPAREGLAGEGDGLLTATPGLVLSVVTADCVPVILAGRAPSRSPSWTVAAVHAGWRGIVAGVVPRSLDALAERGVPPTAVAAWIGPAIGACCYEVSEEVAVQVASASGPECVVPAPPGRPHLDLVAAVRHQLAVAGVPAPRVVLRCTRCDAEHLWSYRRDGRAAGRNHAFVWLEPCQEPARRTESGAGGPEGAPCG